VSGKRARITLIGEPVDERDKGTCPIRPPLLFIRVPLDEKDGRVRERRARLALMRAPIDPKDVSFSVMPTPFVHGWARPRDMRLGCGRSRSAEAGQPKITMLWRLSATGSPRGPQTITDWLV
jgi:hypothetical protein